MPRYKYRALDDQGQPFEGTMEETSGHQVTRKLQERGMTVNSVERLDRERRLLRVSKRLSWEEMQLFTEQLYSVVRSNLPLAPALKAMAQDLRNPRMKLLLERIHTDLEHGMSLEEAVEQREEQFPSIFPAVVRAGEATGNLSGVLQTLCDYSRQMMRLKSDLQVALIYPALVSAVSMILLAIIFVYIVPPFKEVFADMGASLPEPTQFLIGISDLLLNHFGLVCFSIVGGLLILAGAWVLIQRSETGRCWLSAIAMRIPLIGPMHYRNLVSRFSRTLGLLLRSGAPILDSLELAAATTGSALLQRSVVDASMLIASGERIADAFRSTNYFSHTYCWLLGISEERGEADQALDNLAETLERQSQGMGAGIGNALNISLIVILGFVIGFIVTSLYLPIFTLGDQISS